MTKTVECAVEAVRDAIARAAEDLTPEEYDSFMEQLCADSESWEMELEERRDAEAEEE